MGQLTFYCPYTNKPIRSGIELVSPRLPAMSDYPISVHCPYCGFIHHGTMADAWLTDEQVPLPPAKP